jgi:hypothetical protein
MHMVAFLSIPLYISIMRFLLLFFMLPTLAMASVQTLNFQVFRNDKPIGTHQVRIIKQGDSTDVLVDIALKVKVAGLVVYRYTHTIQERWQKGVLQELTATTNKDGKQLRTIAVKQGKVMQVNGSTGAITVPSPIIPTSYWNKAFVQQQQVLDTQDGRLRNISVTKAGEEIITTPAGNVPATKYIIGKELPLTLWYDASGRWVSLTFMLRNSVIKYQLL